MADRQALAHSFLAETGWAGAQVSLLAGDASNRKYFRVGATADRPHAVLMDAPQEKGEDVRPFIAIAELLKATDLSAPAIYAQDPESGFLMLEDLGDDLFSTICDADPSQEEELYKAAIDALLVLHKAPLPKLETYGPELMAELAAQAIDWYALGREGKSHSSDRDALKATMKDLLMPHEGCFTVTALRDFHAQNLLWLPDRSGPARVGLLDFQDAMIGHPAYDLVSLLQDARRDVSPDTEATVIDHYLSKSEMDPIKFREAYTALGAQRALRILMVFARLSLHFGKASYVDLIPRIWGHLQTNLAQPGLERLRGIVSKSLPQPTEDYLKELKDKCGTHPTRS